MKRILIILLVTLNCCVCTSQIVCSVSDIDVDFLNTLSLKAYPIIDSIKASGIKTSRGDIIEDDGSIYLLVDGFFDVFRWSEGEWENLYLKAFGGYNFGSKKFNYGGRIFSFGGYGYWSNHGHLIEFLETRGEWEIIPETINLDDGIAVLDDNVLNIFANGSLQHIDLNTMEIKTEKSGWGIVLEGPLKNLYTFDLENYAINLTTKPHYLLDKKTQEIYLSHLSPFQLVQHTMNEGVLHIAGDEVYCYDRSMNLLAMYTVEEERKFFTLLYGLTMGKANYYLIYIISGVVGLLGLGLFYYRRRKAEDSEAVTLTLKEQESIKSHNLINKLLPYTGHILIQEEFDKALEIDQIKSPESRRYKRSQNIKEVNSFYKGYTAKDFIIRKKDPRDKRRFVYLITEIE